MLPFLSANFCEIHAMSDGLIRTELKRNTSLPQCSQRQLFLLNFLLITAPIMTLVEQQLVYVRKYFFDIDSIS